MKINLYTQVLTTIIVTYRQPTMGTANPLELIKTILTKLFYVHCILLFSVHCDAQIVGKWMTSDSTFLNHPDNTPARLDSALLIFKNNGKYRIDLFAPNIFPFHKQPWKKYYSGKWSLNPKTNKLTLYKNYEKWNVKEEIG